MRRPSLSPDEESVPHNFTFNISEVNQVVIEQDAILPIVVAQQELTADELQQLFSRASSQLITESTDKQEFFKRQSTLKPPKTSQIIQTPFPPTPTAEDRPENVDIDIEQLNKQEVRPLLIERFSPNETKIDYPLSTISMTFNQPMIGVDGISLTPNVKGQWRMIGTKTIQFEANYRLPFSTKFTLQVNQEQCQSAIGGKLTDDFIYEFSTGIPQVIEFTPTGTISTLKPKCFILFNQKINHDQILKHIQIADNEENIELITDTDFKGKDKDKYVAFTFKNDLSKNTEYTIRLPAGCPSAEGPLTTTDEWSTHFKTYEPLQIIDWNPNTNNQRSKSIDPGRRWSIKFNNPLDRSTIIKSLFHIQPEITDLTIELSKHNANEIFIYNKSNENTVYTITIESESIKDVYGQILDHNFVERPIQFHVHNSPPLRGDLSGANGMIIMDPGLLNDPMYSFAILNYSELNIRINRVKPEDYNRQLPCFNAFISQFNRKEDKSNIELPGEELLNEILQTDCEPNISKEIKLPLKSYLTNNSGHGHLIVFIQPTEKAWNQYAHSQRQGKPLLSAWVQCTRLAVDIFRASGTNNKLTAWVTELATGKSVNQAIVSLADQKIETNDQGLCTFEKYKTGILIVKKESDQCILTDINSYESKSDNYVWHIFNDRGLYKPKEEVHIKGYVRLLEVIGDAKIPSYVQGVVEYAVFDSRRQQLHQSTVELNDYGAFNIEFTLPDNVNLGTGHVVFKLPDKQTRKSHSFKIQEFRRPEYEVSSSIRPSSNHYSHATNEQSIVASCQGKLFAGGFLTDANVEWIVYAETTTFTPPNRSDYTFGRARPFFCWFGRNYDDNEIVYPEKQFEGQTNDQGIHEIQINYKGLENEPIPIVVCVGAAIADLNNQVQETQTQFLVHPSKYYVGFQLTTNYGKKDRPIQARVIVTDVDGNLMDNVPIQCQIIGVEQQNKEDEQQLTSLSSNSAATIIEFTPKLGGSYKISFTVKDDEERLATSFYEDFYVTGGTRIYSERKKLEFVPSDKLTVIPNATDYQVGDTCELLISVPFSPANGLIVFDCEGQVGEPIQFEVTDEKDSTTVAFQISKDWVPEFTAHVELIGTCSREIELQDSPTRPAFAVGSVAIQVSRDIYKLNVQVNTNETFTPSSTVQIDVDVTQYIDKSYVDKVEVCLVVVDEAILSLTKYQLQNSLDIFYPKRKAQIRPRHNRDRCWLFHHENITRTETSLLQSEIDELFDSLRGIELEHCCVDQLTEGVEQYVHNMPTIAVRSNFNPLACWIPSAITNSSGHVSFEFKLPDNLTRYRVWALAANDKQYGLGEMSFTVELPVMIRPSPPRFLNFGDTAYLAVILQNQTNSSLLLHTGLKASNAKLLTSEANQQTAGYAVQLPANKRIAVTFPLSTIQAGTARFQFLVGTVGNQSQTAYGDAIELSIPIFTPATSEAFATYGDIAEEQVVFQPIKPPANILPQFGELSVSTSSTALASLTDAILALYDYPYECTEQISSRLLGILSLWDVLQAFNSKDLPDLPTIQTKLQSNIKKLENRQYSNGGFGFWTKRNDSHPDPFVSVHAAHCLVVVTRKNICQVDNSMLRNALKYLANIQSEVNELSETTRFSLICYGLYVRAKHLENVAGAALQLFTQTGFNKLSLEALGWLLMALSTDKNNKSIIQAIEMIYEHLKGKVNETAETANFITSYGDDGQSVMLHSNQRTDAILLEALLTIDPNSTLCTKLCKGLQAHRVKGAWKSTQENCFVLIALNKYFGIKEKDKPDFSANIWLDEDYCGQHKYQHRTTDTQTVQIPMKAVLSSNKNVIMQKVGNGRLYYRIGLNYAPENLQLNAVNYGFKVQRTYVGVDNVEDVQKQADGTWKFKLGAKIRVELTMTTTQRRYHIALVDYLPAGCESLTGDTDYYYYYGWPDHENLRDERAEAFRSLLWPGVYQWSYIMRATSAGTFIIPPAKAEEMYSPENFGRSATEKALIN